MVPIESFGTVSNSHSTATMVVSLTVSAILSVKEWPDLEILVRSRSKSLEMGVFDKSHRVPISVP